MGFHQFIRHRYPMATKPPQEPNITWYRTWYSVSGCSLILHVGPSRSTKITVTLFTIISTYSPLAAEKSGDMNDRVTADSPYSGVLCSGA